MEKKIAWFFFEEPTSTRTLKAREKQRTFSELQEKKREMLLGHNESHFEFPNTKLFCFLVLTELSVLACRGS